MPTPDPRPPSAGGHRRPSTSRALCRAETVATPPSRSSCKNLVTQPQARKRDFDATQMMVCVEQADQLFGAESFGNPRIGSQVGVQVAVARPDLARGGLDQVVRLTAGHTLLDQGQQHLARVDQAARKLE